MSKNKITTKDDFEIVTENLFGHDGIKYVIHNNTIWMTQSDMALMVDKSVRNVRKHLKNKFDSGELSREEHTLNPNEGNKSSFLHINPKAKKQPILYSLDALMALAYTVNSKQAVEIRKWSNKVLSQFTIHGIVVDSHRVVTDDETFQKAIQIANFARTRGRDVLKSTQDLYKGAEDYESGTKKTNYEIALGINLMLKAVSDMTASELKYHRSDPTKPNCGMTVFSGKKAPTLEDATVGTNFLKPDELQKNLLLIEHLYTGLNVFLCDRPKYKMKDITSYIKKQIAVLNLSVLEDNGTISKVVANKVSRKRLQQWRKDKNHIIIKDMMKKTKQTILK